MEVGRGHLLGPVEHSKGKGGVSVVAIPRFLCGSPRLCRLRTEGLIPVNKYWMYRSHASDMGPVSLVACCRQMFDLLHCLIGDSGEKLGMDPWIGQPVCCGLCQQPFFSGAVTLSNCVGDSWNVATYRDRPHEAFAGVRGLAWKAYVSCWLGFLLYGVNWFESSRLSDMSNHLFMSAIK
jgi:hypothetical protein